MLDFFKSLAQVAVPVFVVSTMLNVGPTGDVTLHDLVDDPGELENIGNPAHPNHDPALVERMLGKLHKLVEAEIGEDRAPFDLDMFGTREVMYRAEPMPADPVNPT